MNITIKHAGHKAEIYKDSWIGGICYECYIYDSSGEWKESFHSTILDEVINAATQWLWDKEEGQGNTNPAH